MSFSVAIHESLAKAYRVVAVLFLPPARSRGVIEEKGLAALLRESGESLLLSPCMETGEALKELGMALEECLGSEECWHEFNYDMTVNAITAARKVPCPLYESTYRIGGKNRLIAAPAISEDLQRYYARIGLEASEGQGVTVDHITVELEFLAALHEAEARMLQGSYPPDLVEELRSMRRGFLAEHALAWMPQAASCLEERAATPLLRGLARALRALLDCEGLLYA